MPAPALAVLDRFSFSSSHRSSETPWTLQQHLLPLGFSIILVCLLKYSSESMDRRLSWLENDYDYVMRIPIYWKELDSFVLFLGTGWA